jgi:hypothetical protein
MLISVHIPKTAGTTFGALLSRRYGPGLLKDYDDRPLSHSGPVRLVRALAGIPRATRRLRGYEAVHGHFLPLKYLAARGDVVVWLRDPVQRMVSRYEHYLRDVEARRPLQAIRGLRPGLDLATFIEIPRFHNTYAKYLRGFPRERVACFGFSEDMAEGLARMQRRLGLDLAPAGQENVNPSRAGQRYDVPAAIERRIQGLNREDLRLWRWAREREGA